MWFQTIILLGRILRTKCTFIAMISFLSMQFLMSTLTIIPCFNARILYQPAIPKWFDPMQINDTN